MKSLGRSLLVLVAVLGVAQKSPGHRIKNYPRWTNLFPLSILRYPFLPQRNTIMNAIERNGFFTLAAMLERSGLAFSLSGGGSGTLFAPTNRAFAALSPRTLTELHTNHTFLKKVLLGHLVSRTLYSKMLSNDMKVNSLAKNPLTFKVNYRGASVNGADIVRADIRASKGVIHAIDQVLLPSQEPPESILDVAEANGFSTLIAYAQIAGLSSILDNDGPITLFAPTNEAFAALPSKTQNDLRTDPRLLKTILLGHIAPKKLYSSSLSNNLEVESLSGNPLKFQADFRRRKSVNGANIVKKDVEASNGVIHAIDKVLLPESEKPSDSLIDTAVVNGLSQFVTYAQTAGLGTTLTGGGPYTIFAPTNKAFSAMPLITLGELQTDPDLLEKVLLGHIVNGEVFSFTLSDGLKIKSLAEDILSFQVDFKGKSVNGSNIEVEDIKASNGIIHIIDKVILPDLEQPSSSLIDTALANGLTQFVIFAQNAGLGSTLAEDGPYTIFAPTNKAFSAIPLITLGELQTDPDLLEKVLLGHVVNGEVFSFTLSDGLKIKSLADDILSFQVDFKGKSVNGSNIEVEDIKASNGIIHIIDKVILPNEATPSGSIIDIAEANGLSQFVASVQNTGLTPILTGEGPLTVFAPTNEAFSAIPLRTLRELQANPNLLRKVLSGHAVNGKIFSSSLSDGFRVNSLAGNTLRFQVDFRGISVNGANIDITDLEAENGIVHVIDKVMLPDEETQNSIVDVAVANGFSSFATYVQNAGLGSTLSEDGPFTVFAPTDEAFSALPFSTLNELQTNPDRFKDVLLSHVARSRVYFDELFNNLEIGSLSGNPLKFQVDFFGSSVNGANIIQRDIEASNGVIHAIDQVIFPEEGGSTPGSSLDVAVDNGYTTFVTYVQNAGLTAALEGDDILTIFVPTNAAFENLPRTTIDDLLRDSEYLRQVLLSHVTRGRIFSNNLTNNLVATSISGNPLTFRVFGRTILVNGATVVKPDVETASGSVIHAIDRVIIPISRNSGREIIFRN